MSRQFAMIAVALAASFGVSPALAKTEINLWFGLSGRLQQAVLDQCERFNAAQADVQVNCTREGTYDEVFQKAVAAYRTGNQPHILQVVDRGTGTMMLSGAAVPAYELVEKYMLDIDWNEYFGAIGNYYADSKGNYWAFPFNSSTAMVYYNTDALKAAGYEQFPSTWEDFDQLLNALRDKAGLKCSMAWTFDLWSDMEQFSAIHNQPVATRSNGYDGLDAELVVNKTRFKDLMELQVSWFREGLVKYDKDFDARRKLFVSGECPIMFDSIAGFTTTKGLTDQTGTKWTVAELPHFADTKPINNLVGGAAFWTMKGFSDAEYEAVGKFFAFIAKADQQKTWSNATGYFPVTKSAFNEMVAEGYYQTPENLNKDLAVKSLLRAEPTALSRGIRLGNYVEIRNIITEELEKALNNQQTVQQALDRGVERGNALLRRFEATYAGSHLP